MIIDFRLRPPTGDFLKSAQFNPERNAKMTKSFGMWQMPSTLHHSMDLFFEEMGACGITMGVLPGRVSYELGNITCESLRGIMETWPGKFAAFAGVDLLDAPSAFAVIEREVLNGPFAGINVEPMGYENPMYADDRRIYPIYERAQEAGIPIMLMTGGFPKAHLSFTHPGHLDTVATDFPQLAIAVPHGCWPHTREVVQVALRKENIYLSPDIYSMGLPGWQDYLFAARHFLQDRFMFGSAHPTLPMSGCVEFYKKLDLPEDILEKIFYRNALRFLDLKNQRSR